MASPKTATSKKASIGKVTPGGEVRVVKPQPAKFNVTRSANTGRFIINGVDEAKLVNKHPDVRIQRAPGKPKHLSRAQISAMVKVMKVA
ncbi:hypothetical protein PLCT2_02980 [Planctomycetaceae bacterium]|nr:hypothetical protein PLCT2_02980 [Planctomycetaceae bacterium]